MGAIAATTAGEGCCARGAVTILGAGVVARECELVEGLGIESRRDGVLAQNAAHLGELERFARIGGLGTFLKHRNESVVQRDQALTAPKLGKYVRMALVTLRKSIEAAASRRLSFAETTLRQERLTKSGVRHV
jgi:hypothetical protein